MQANNDIPFLVNLGNMLDWIYSTKIVSLNNNTMRATIEKGTVFLFEASHLVLIWFLGGFILQICFVEQCLVENCLNFRSFFSLHYISVVELQILFCGIVYCGNFVFLIICTTYPSSTYYVLLQHLYLHTFLIYFFYTFCIPEKTL